MDFVVNRFKRRVHQVLINVEYPKVRALILQGATGVLHIGGHHGQEAEEYASLGLPVRWIEAHPDYFEILKSHISNFPNQVAINALLGDENGKQTKFYVASNEGASSSILALSENHGFEKSGLRMTDEVFLKMATLDFLISSAEIENLSHWVIDVQGAELKVLSGAVASLKYASSLEVEVSTREVYKGGVQFSELRNFLQIHGLFPLQVPPSNWHGNVLFVRLRTST
jgi:FkbM family methyltransferase